MRRLSVLPVTLLFGWLYGQESPSINRERRWQEDLKAFSEIMHGTKDVGTKQWTPGQKDLQKLYPTFDRDLQTLTGEIGKLRDGEIHLRLAKILASARVAHNIGYLNVPESLPVSVSWLDEGPIVTGASEDYRSIIGARIKKVGGLSPDQLLDTVAPYIAFETEAWKRVRAADVSRSKVLLETVHLSKAGRVELIVEGTAGETTVSMAFAPSNTRQIRLRETVRSTIPLAETRPEQRYYWSQFLEDPKALYIQYNQCADDPKQSFKDFAAKALAEADERGVKRVVVDLRFNTGGASWIVKPLIAGLSARRKAIGVPYVLIGPQTFSSGVMAANDFRKAKAKLVGSPTGGMLKGYGESSSKELPNSRFRFQYTIKNFGSSPAIRPDIAVSLTAENVREGRDVVLEAALKAP